MKRSAPMKRSPIKREKPISEKARAKRRKAFTAEMAWSHAVRLRDYYRCRRCGKRDYKNHAHHIAPRSRRPDLKFDLSNGMTVCSDCYNWIHSNPIEAELLGFLSSETYEKSRRESIVNSALA